MPLSELVLLKTGPFGSALHKSEYVARGIPVVNPMHIKAGKIFPGAEARVSEEVLARLAHFKLALGDVVLGRRGEMGRCAVVGQTEAGWLCGTGSLILRSFGTLEPRYLQRFLSSPEVVERLKGESVGSTMVNLNQSILRGLNVLLPPLPEQKRIADKLDALLARVDACRERLDRVPKILKRFRQSVLAAATSGELTREWREARGLTDERKWEEVRLAELGELGRGKSKHRPRNDSRLYQGPYPFIQTGDVAQSGGTIERHSQNYSEFGLAQSKLWPAGTVCITIAANIADTAILSYPACFPDSIVGFVANPAKALPEFVKWSIDVISDRLESFAPATAQKNINLAILNDIVLHCPGLAEQQEIVRRTRNLLELTERMAQRHVVCTARIGSLTPTILAKAFRGELVPQDPNDEPASELLARIRSRVAVSGSAKPKRGKA